MCCVAGLSEYFRYFGLELSITTVRQMLESACFEAMQVGTVSMDQYLNSCAAQVLLLLLLLPLLLLPLLLLPLLLLPLLLPLLLLLLVL